MIRTFLKVKDIVMSEDDRESNIVRDSSGNVIGNKQSKCTCKFVLENKEGNEFEWVAENKSLYTAIEKIGLNEEKKYPNGFGRNMFFLAWLYDFYEHYLTKFGFNPPKKDLDFCKKMKHGKY